MSISGGGDRRHLRPLNPDGQYEPGTLGTHKANYETLNVPGAQPSFHYFWCRHPKHDRNGAQFKRMVNVGFEPVPPGSPEHKGRFTPDYNYPELGLDGYKVHGDLVLMRIPLEKYRAICEYRTALAKSAVSGPTDQFLSKGEALQQRYGAGADGPIYYRVGGHGISHTDTPI